MQSHERLSTTSKQIPVEVGFTFYYTDKRLKYTSKDFVYDDDEDVRAVVASLGFGLDVLINDKSEFVSLIAQKRLNSKNP
ncbi:MAG: hypothetical protein KH433_01170 [Campylobacter concisus]|nr:hypothetical protein [Campylobacter concisus]